jgi:hypothetical protein
MSARKHLSVFGRSTFLRRQSFLVHCNSAGFPGRWIPETGPCCTPTVLFRHQSVKGLLPSAKYSPESARFGPQWTSVPNPPYLEVTFYPVSLPWALADGEHKLLLHPPECGHHSNPLRAFFERPRPDLNMRVSLLPLLAATVAAQQAAATPYGQCGGVGFVGPTGCGTGYYCTVYK